MRPRLAGTRLTRAAVPRPAPAGSRVAAAALVVSGLAVSRLTVPGVAGPRRARTGLGGRRLAGLKLARPGLAGRRLAGLDQDGRGLARQSLRGLGMARPQLAGPGQVRPMRPAGLGRVDPDQPRGRGDREQPGDQYHADDQRPAIGPPAAGQPGVFRPRLMVGLGVDLDQPGRLGILGHARGQRRRRRGRAVLGRRPGLVRCGLICCGLIRFGGSGLGRDRVIGRRDAAGPGIAHAGLGGDDRGRARMRRDDRGDRSLGGQGSRPRDSGERGGIGGARAILSPPPAASTGPASTGPASTGRPPARPAAAAALAAPAPAVELVAAPQRVQNRNIPLTGDPHLVQNLIGVSPA